MSIFCSLQNLVFVPNQPPDQISIRSRHQRIPSPSLPILAKIKHTTDYSIKGDEDYGIPANQVKTLAKFDSLHNHIRVLEVSRRASHPLAGSRLMLLDHPGNIHSISFLLNPLTSAYFDIFATLPPILPPGPIALLGFGAGSTARILLHLYPDLEIHGWELDPAVVAVARRFFGLAKLEQQHRTNLFIHIGDALGDASIGDGFAGIVVDLFHKGSVITELQDKKTWKRLKGRLRRGGRIMANCGGKCVESEDLTRDGQAVMEETVMAMRAGFAAEVFVLMLDYGDGEGCVAMTGPWPKGTESWKRALPKPLMGYVDKWRPFNS